MGKKHLAIAVITDPALVAARAAAGGGVSDAGAIYVNIPELEFNGDDMVYCRYGLSIPYMRVQILDKLWVETSIDEDERWIYTGFADCAGRVGTIPTSADQLILDLFANSIYATTVDTLHLGSKTAVEPFVKGLVFGVESAKDTANWVALKAAMTSWTPVPGDGGAALKAAITAFLALPNGNYPATLSTKVFGR